MENVISMEGTSPNDLVCRTSIKGRAVSKENSYKCIEGILFIIVFKALKATFQHMYYNPAVCIFLPTFWKSKTFYNEFFSVNSILMYG